MHSLRTRSAGVTVVRDRRRASSRLSKPSDEWHGALSRRLRPNSSWSVDLLRWYQAEDPRF